MDELHSGQMGKVNEVSGAGLLPRPFFVPPFLNNR